MSKNAIKMSFVTVNGYDMESAVDALNDGKNCPCLREVDTGVRRLRRRRLFDGTRDRRGAGLLRSRRDGS